MPANKNVSWLQLLSIIGNVFLLVSIAFLIAQNRQLKNQIDAINKTLSPDPIAINEIAPPFYYSNMQGQIDSVAFRSGKSHLLLLYSLTCPHCEKNWELWKHIAGSINTSEISILRLSVNSLEKTKEHLQHKPPDAITTGSIMPDTTFPRKYKLSTVPQTIYINNNGIVKGVWVGELRDEQKQEIIKRCQPGTDNK